MPITWAIPQEQPAGAGADDRWRETNDVFLTVVRVRLSVRCVAPVRIRLVV